MQQNQRLTNELVEVSGDLEDLSSSTIKHVVTLLRPYKSAHLREKEYSLSVSLVLSLILDQPTQHKRQENERDLSKRSLVVVVYSSPLSFYLADTSACVT